MSSSSGGLARLIGARGIVSSNRGFSFGVPLDVSLDVDDLDSLLFLYSSDEDDEYRSFRLCVASAGFRGMCDVMGFRLALTIFLSVGCFFGDVRRGDLERDLRFRPDIFFNIAQILFRGLVGGSIRVVYERHLYAHHLEVVHKLLRRIRDDFPRNVVSAIAPFANVSFLALAMH